MAVWQADFSLVPASALPADYAARLDGVAARGRSWAPELETWGAEDGDRVDVWSEAGRPADALVRFDLRAPDPAFAAGVLAFARGCGLRLEDVEGRTIEPVAGELALALRGSRAFRFIENPERYLTRLLVGGLADA